MPAQAILVASAIAWVCALILISVANHKPRVGALVERAIIATGLALFGTFYGLVATNTDFGLGILDPETAKFLVRFGVVTIVGGLPLIWVGLWLTGRLGEGTTAQGDRIEAAIAHNTKISQDASDHADAAYHEANSVNLKIATAQQDILAQGEDRATDRADAKRLEGTVDKTAGQVEDIHHKTVGES